MLAGPRRLGGNSEIAVALPPREAAAAAADRRGRDNKWCPTADVATGEAVIDLVSDDEDADVEVTLTPSQHAQQEQAQQEQPPDPLLAPRAIHDAAASRSVDVAAAPARCPPAVPSTYRGTQSRAAGKAVEPVARCGAPPSRAEPKRQRMQQPTLVGERAGQSSPQRAAAAAALARAQQLQDQQAAADLQVARSYCKTAEAAPSRPADRGRASHATLQCGNRTAQHRTPEAAGGAGAAMSASGGAGPSSRHTSSLCLCTVDLTDSPALTGARSATGS
jgi:hypothetical protein